MSADYFRTLGIPVLAGREFSNADSRTAPGVAVVNDEFVRRFFPRENPIGRQLYPWSTTPATIVGVARSVRQKSLDEPPRAEVYIAAAQAPQRLADITYVVSTEGDPAALAAAVRAAVHDVAPEQPVFLMKTMDDVLADSLRSRKLTLSLLALFATLAVVLSAAGVYGVTSYGVSERRAALGVAIGLVAAAALTRVLRGLLYSVDSHDPATFAIVAVGMSAVTILASCAPALRAARVDPIDAMRTD